MSPPDPPSTSPSGLPSTSRPGTGIHALGASLATSDVITTSLMDIAEGLASQAWRAQDPDAYRAGVDDACEAARERLVTEVTLSVGEVLDVLRHELTTPLFVVAAAAETLLRRSGHLAEDHVLTFLNMMHRNSVLLQALVASIPRSGETVGAFSITREPVDLADLLRAIVDDAAVLDRAHRFDLSLPAEPAVALVDPQAVRRILNALLSNAAKFSPPSTPIRVTLRLPDGWVVVCVTDAGTGIAAAHREAVFDKFRRFDSGVGGSGLGLYLARGLAREHGGDLTVSDPERHPETDPESHPEGHDDPEGCAEVERGGGAGGAVLVLRLPRTPAGAA